jgi:hypothetical protein
MELSGMALSASEAGSLSPQRLPYDGFFFAACWINTPQVTLGQFADQVERFAAQLATLHPAFQGLHLVGDSKKDSPALTADLSNLRQWVMRRSWHEGAPTNARYSHQQPDGSLTPLSRGDMGFSLELSNLRASPEKLQLIVTDGAKERGCVQLTIPATLAGAMGDTDFVTSLLDLIRINWPVRFASLYSSSWDEAVNPAPPSHNLLPIGGITFSTDASLVQALPARTPWRAMTGGGVLLTVTARPDQLDAQALAQAVAIRAALAAHGMLALR